MFARGFTLLELVITLIVIGILAAFVTARLDFVTGFDQRGVHDKANAALQFARKAAVAQRRYVCVSIGGGSLTLTVDPNVPESTASPFGGTCPFGTVLNLPAPDKDCGGALNQVCSRTGATLASGTPSFQFDAQGRVSTTVAVTVTGQPSITVEGETGYVH